MLWNFYKNYQLSLRKSTQFYPTLETLGHFGNVQIQKTNCPKRVFSKSREKMDPNWQITIHRHPERAHNGTVSVNILSTSSLKPMHQWRLIDVHRCANVYTCTIATSGMNSVPKGLLHPIRWNAKELNQTLYQILSISCLYVWMFWTTMPTWILSDALTRKLTSDTIPRKSPKIDFI